MRNANQNADAELGLEAAEWLLNLSDAELEHKDAQKEAFLAWVAKSPDHLRIFLETVEIHRRLPQLDSGHSIDIEQLLAKDLGEVIRLYDKAETPTPQRRSPPPSRKRSFIGTAASVAVMGVATLAYLLMVDSHRYATSIGEQRSAKLADGSFIYLNTDSQVDVDFSDMARSIRLMRGEAFFIVERDSQRPFIVSSGGTQVRAVGTQFNVRHRTEGTYVAVLEGAVQVTAGGAPKLLAAGEQAHVARGQVIARSKEAVTDAVAWRQRRLVFHDAKLAEVAAEFNRYNRTKIRVEGKAALDMLLTGIFDADRPQALMLYAANREELSVVPEGGDWVIRGR